MIMITPNEFLQFANEMGLGRIKSTSSSSISPSPLISHNNNYTTTGLSVLNNLCHLIEEIHQLKTENNRLRSHLELVNHVELFQQRFVVNDINENKQEKNESIISSPSIHDEDKFEALSPTGSLRSKYSPSIRERKGIHFFNNQEDSSSISHINHDRSEATDSNIGLSSISNRNNWSKVRHVFKFSLLRKYGSPSSSHITNIERNIPAINISLESEEDHLQEHKHSLKKKKTVTTTNDNRQMIMGDETDQEDESIHFIRSYHKRRLNENDRLNSSSLERQEILSTSSPCNAMNIDDEALLTRKPSKIARYRRKLRSKLDTVKRQFSDQNSSTPSLRIFHTSHISVFDVDDKP